jgi:hypothetical protein
VGIVATVGANLAHGLGHGPVGALVSAWPALALVGSYELLMLLIRGQHRDNADGSANPYSSMSVVAQDESPFEPPTLLLEQMVQAWHD